MAFIVEDGTGIDGATSYIEIAYADEYFADRGNTVWPALTEEQKQAALIQASDYVSTHYTYKGTKASTSQGLAFPRIGVVDQSGLPVTGVPECIKKCTAELAVRASQSALVPDPEFDDSGRAVKMKSEVLGPLKRTLEYAGPGDLLNEARYPAVDALMCPWLVKSALTLSHGVKVVRAGVSGVSRSDMRAIHSDSDRYTGPLNENNKDVGEIDGDSAF